MWLWQCSGCFGGNKLLVIPHPRGRSCLAFFGCVPGLPDVVDDGGTPTLFRTFVVATVGVRFAET